MKALKNIFVFFLALVYSVAGSGMLLSQHYCGGEYVDFQIELGAGTLNAELCDDCGMEAEEGNSCCESKTQLVKKTIEHQNDYHQVWDFELSQFILPAAIIVPQQKAIPLLALEQSVWCRLQKPPPKSLALFKEICCYRI